MEKSLLVIRVVVLLTTVALVCAVALNAGWLSPSPTARGESPSAATPIKPPATAPDKTPAEKPAAPGPFIEPSALMDGSKMGPIARPSDFSADTQPTSVDSTEGSYMVYF